MHSISSFASKAGLASIASSAEATGANATSTASGSNKPFKLEEHNFDSNTDKVIDVTFGNNDTITKKHAGHPEYIGD